MRKETFDEVLDRSDPGCEVTWLARGEVLRSLAADSAFELTEDDLARLRAGEIVALENCGEYTVFVRLKTPNSEELSR